MKTPATAGRLARHALLAAALALTGCAVGPDFERPRPPTVQRYTTTDVVAVPADAREAAQHVADGATIPAGWWELFHSPPLDDVLRQAIAGNQTVAAAEATLLAARQAVLAAEGAFYPQVDFGASYTREHNGARSGTSSTGNVVTGGFNLYSLGPTVSYAPDVFGGTRRQVEEQSALAEKQHYQLAAAYLTLTGNAATQALAIASARMQLDAAQSIIDDDERNATLVRQKRDAGKAADVDVLTAESQLAVDRTQIPPLRQQLSVARHALAVLVGRFPAEWSAPDFDLAELTLPETLPATLPSELVHQRPDILAAEAQLHADSAAVGVATAQMYPSFTLSAALSGEGISSNAAFPGATLAWSAVGGVAAPIFHGGTLRAQRREAVETFNATFATYRQTVLAAFGQVADTLRALEHDADLVDAERYALDTSDRARELQRISYQEGKSDLLQLLDAERLYQQARLGYARAQAQRYQDTVQLFVAMGGGWWQLDAPGLQADGLRSLTDAQDATHEARADPRGEAVSKGEVEVVAGARAGR
jgi:NodT family efflux transporter outer membrane factor (OMF) lipoprotein